jgi:hypothetical protein
MTQGMLAMLCHPDDGTNNGGSRSSFSIEPTMRSKAPVVVTACAGG